MLTESQLITLYWLFYKGIGVQMSNISYYFPSKLCYNKTLVVFVPTHFKTSKKLKKVKVKVKVK
jgi:hypothetical protein